MRIKFLGVLFLIGLASCGEENPSDTNIVPESSSSYLIDEDTLQLEQQKLIITGPDSSEMPNKIDPGNIANISKISKNFSFNSGNKTRYHFKDSNFFRLCVLDAITQQYPKASWILQSDGQTMSIKPNSEVILQKDTQYILKFSLEKLDCAGESYYGEFSFQEF